MSVVNTRPVDQRFWILGAGMTGLAASWASGLPALEAAEIPGGICRSYFVESGSGPGRYRFEIGGGHWIFGGDPTLTRFLEGFGAFQRYWRKSSVYFPDSGQYVPYPLQHNLRYMSPDVAAAALKEIRAGKPAQAASLREFLREAFGSTLNELFFKPFHELYTAGLASEIAPQDAYKTPVDLKSVEAGMHAALPGGGYNHSFLYPESGLAWLADSLAQVGRIHYGAQVERIDTNRAVIELSGGERLPYQALVSTLPLDRMVELTGIQLDEEPDPSTSVLVLNIGGVRGPRCPDDHWLYIPHTRSGFHRVGFYSNVDASFLPAGREDLVSLYVERAFASKVRPAQTEIETYSRAVVDELRDWGFLTAVDVVDATWIPVAYTWMRPGSRWREKAIQALEERGIQMTGRYGRWRFQGIADSIRDGLLAGAALRSLASQGRGSGACS